MDTQDPIRAWFHEFRPGVYGLYVCGRSFIRDHGDPAMCRAAYWSVLRCRWLCPRNVKSYKGMPAAGRYLDHEIRCLRCGCQYIVMTDNSPQIIGPWRRDRSRPRHHFPEHVWPWYRRIAPWLRMVRHNLIGW
jgi:hypothetical protein